MRGHRRVDRERQRDHRDRQQRTADEVERRRLVRLAVRQVALHGDEADHADRHVDDEHPVPGNRLREPAAERRPDDRAELAGDRHERDRRDVLFARHAAQHGEPADRQQHRAADALQRAATSWPSVCDAAQPIEASTNTRIASENTRRVPNRSASQPDAGVSIAIVSV